MMTEVEGPTTGVFDALQQKESSISRPADDTYLPADEVGKGLLEMGSDIDGGDLKMIENGSTKLEVRLEGL